MTTVNNAAPSGLTDERTAFESYVRDALSFDGDGVDPCKRGQCGYLESNIDSAWCAWQARALFAAAPKAAEQAPVADAARADALAIESALFELINKIDNDLDTGDVVKDARHASAALDVILSKGDLVANAHDYFRDTPHRYEHSIEFRIGWNACLDALQNARTAAPAQQAPALTDAARDVLAERRRQVEQEGRTPAHDDQYLYGQMATAAGCYAMFTQAYPVGDPSKYWPWAAEWWKPTTPRRNLVKAGALIQAEIERLDRAALQSHPEGSQRAD